MAHFTHMKQVVLPQDGRRGLMAVKADYGLSIRVKASAAMSAKAVDGPRLEKDTTHIA